MRPEFPKKIIITDALTGNHLKTIDLDDWRPFTVENMVCDVFYDDLNFNRHGFLLKYGD